MPKGDVKNQIASMINNLAPNAQNQATSNPAAPTQSAKPAAQPAPVNKQTQQKPAEPAQPNCTHLKTC